MTATPSQLRHQPRPSMSFNERVHYERSAFCVEQLQHAFAWLRRFGPERRDTVPPFEPVNQIGADLITLVSVQRPAIRQASQPTSKPIDPEPAAPMSAMQANGVVDAIRIWIASLRTAHAAERRLTELVSENMPREDRSQQIFEEFYAPRANVADGPAHPSGTAPAESARAASSSCRAVSPALRFGLLGLTAAFGLWLLFEQISPPRIQPATPQAEWRAEQPPPPSAFDYGIPAP